MIRVFVAVYYLHLIWRIIISGWPWDTMKIYAEQLPSFSCVIKTNHPFFLLTYSEMHFVLFIKLVNKDYRSQLREVSEALHPLGMQSINLVIDTHVRFQLAIKTL